MNKLIAVEAQIYVYAEDIQVSGGQPEAIGIEYVMIGIEYDIVLAWGDCYELSGNFLCLIDENLYKKPQSWRRLKSGEWRKSSETDSSTL